MQQSRKQKWPDTVLHMQAPTLQCSEHQACVIKTGKYKLDKGQLTRAATKTHVLLDTYVAKVCIFNFEIA
jgi:hypothetical protein